MTLWQAIPFWVSLLLVPVAVLGATLGGWALLATPVCTWYLFALLDRALGADASNADPNTPDAGLFWHRLITLIWAPVQFATVFGLIWFVTSHDTLAGWEKLAAFFGVGILTGTIGIVYSHELMHQADRRERWLADILLAMVLYSHFRSEHLLVHHRYVGTPRDAVTARYNEGFHRFFPRVLRESFASSCAAEAAFLARKGLPPWHRSNPFWRYAVLQAGFLMLAALVGGWEGLGLFIFQAFVAIWQLELVNYVEHYGLTRKHLGDGTYEHTQPHHSWNGMQKASNWLLINLQRHSDHHYKPSRRYPLLQSYSAEDAPELPRGYAMMTLAAMIPPLWRRIMNPRVRDWRRRHYPEIEDWAPYTAAANPMPR